MHIKTAAYAVIFAISPAFAADKQPPAQDVLGNPGIELEDGFLPPATPEPAQITPPEQDKPAEEPKAKSDQPKPKPSKSKTEDAKRSPKQQPPAAQPQQPDKDPVINAALEEVKRADAEFASALEQIRAGNKEQFAQFFERYASAINNAKVRNDADGIKKIVQRLRLRLDISSLINAYKQPNADKAKIRKELETRLEDEFQSKLEIQELQIKQLEQTLAGLKAEIAKRKDNKQEMLKDRADELLGEKMKW